MAAKTPVPENSVVPLERITESILWLRGQKVMLDGVRCDPRIDENLRSRALADQETAHRIRAMEGMITERNDCGRVAVHQ